MDSYIIEYLKKDYVSNLDLIYALDHGAQVLYFNKSGIMLKFDDLYMIAIDDKEIVKHLLNELDECSMLVIHNDDYKDLITEKFNLNPKLIVYQYGYLKDYVRILDNPNINIKAIGMEYFDFIKANYSTSIDESYLIERVKANVFIGAFDDNKIVGFAGIHDEGTIGFVEVIPEYRRLGIASLLETYMIDKLLQAKKMVFLQVEINNEASMQLHEKLGFQRSSEIITWYM